MKQLSILIPARNEEFLGITIQNILDNIESDTEIITVLDGYTTPIPEIPEDPRVTVITLPKSIGQRAATNLACKLSEAKYVAKVDAHCAFDKGFDRILLADMQEDWTVVPTMRNLWAFDWKCKNGHTRYQSPSGPCKECGEPTEKDIKWIAKKSPQSNAYCFDSEPHFQYFREYSKRPEGKGDLTETMSLQGSFFMLSREKYWELQICDESFGSWGSQGIEVAVKTWLSGGKVMVNQKTYYAHMFRTQGGDFGFPYPQSGRQVEKAKDVARKLFYDNKWPKQIYPISWLVERFWPVKGWSQENFEKLKAGDALLPTYNTQLKDAEIPQEGPTRGILYYTDNKLNMKLAATVRKQLEKMGLPITSVTLKPTNFGRNIVLKEPRGYKTMYKQILAGLEAMTEDIVYFAEHDVLYHPDHFKFVPKEHKFYYNGNYWFVRPDGFAVHYNVSPLSGLVVYREDAIAHFKERIALIEKKGFGYYMGFEPFTHKRVKWDTWFDFEVFLPDNPNIDIAHGGNLTNKRWSQEKFIRKPKFWEEGTVSSITGWDTRELVSQIGGIA